VLQSIELGPDYKLLDPIPAPAKEQASFPRKNMQAALLTPVT
jgi:hypothetical protein